MADFFTQPYFEEVVERLNHDPEFQAKTASVAVTVLMIAKDRGRAFLLTVDNGSARVAPAAEDAKADFAFVGDYATWASNHRGEAPLDKLVMTGRLKFKGSIPRIMSLRSQLVVIDKLAQTVSAEI